LWKTSGARGSLGFPSNSRLRNERGFVSSKWSPLGCLNYIKKLMDSRQFSELLLVPCESAQSHFVFGLNLHVAKSLKDPAEIAMFR